MRGSISLFGRGHKRKKMPIKGSVVTGQFQGKRHFSVRDCIRASSTLVISQRAVGGMDCYVRSGKWKWRRLGENVRGELVGGREEKINGWESVR